MPAKKSLKERERSLLERLKSSDGVPYGTLDVWAKEEGVTDLQQFIDRHLESRKIRVDRESGSHPELIKPTAQAWQM